MELGLLYFSKDEIRVETDVHTYNKKTNQIPFFWNKSTEKNAIFFETEAKNMK